MCLLGDGATVRGMPLMNVLVSTPNACSVLDIIDCTDHMEVGGKKDAKYIADVFGEHIEALDPNGLHLNAILFDGASNVQKAGRVIEAKYPQVSVLHGIEHVISLFFSDVSRLSFVRYLIINYRRVYRVFGSGSMHAPYAMFQKQAKTFNGGVKIGLIRAADTRMAGYFIAFHRLLRLRPAAEATIASVEFQGLNLSKSVVVKAVDFLKNAEMWNALHCLTRCLFPALRVLRLADKSEPGFDCLFYFVRRAEKAMDWSVRSFENVSFFTTVARDPQVMNDILYHGGPEHDIPDEEDDELTDMLAEAYDDSDVEGDSDDDSVLGETNNGAELGQKIITLWNKRRGRMVSDFAIAGWLLSPLEEVMSDVKAGRAGEYGWEMTEAMDRILNKMYHNLKDDELGELKDNFWTEYDEFSNKVGRFGDGRKYIWNSGLLRQRKSAKWHAQYSVQHTMVSQARVCVVVVLSLFLTNCSSCFCFPQVLGKVACRILSALLGIGVAERSWGAVKHLKTGSRSHLGSEATRMQATIFGAACIEKARVLKAEKEQSLELWNDNDVEFQLGLENFSADEAEGVAQQVNPRRLFHAWREDWEAISSKTNDLVHETRLLRKYGGLRWSDPDSESNQMFVADRDNLEWRRAVGWCVIAIGEDGVMEPWPVKLLPSLIKKTRQDEVQNVEFVHLSRAEKESRRAAKEAAWAADSNGGGKKGSKKNKRKFYDSESDSDSDGGN
jgi:hypothetical protein